MTASLEIPYYTPPEPDGDRITEVCVYEVDRLGTVANCGLDLPDDADNDALFCSYHDAAVDRGDITWKEYQTYRAHYGA